MTWQSNEPLPGAFEWGYARSSRHRANAGPVVCHVIVRADVQMFCSGGLGLFGNGGGKPCPKCVALVRDYLGDDE